MAAIASPLPATIPSTLLAGRSYARAGHIDRGCCASACSSACRPRSSARLTRWIPGGELVLVTDVILLVLGLRVLLHTRHTTKTSRPRNAPASRGSSRSRARSDSSRAARQQRRIPARAAVHQRAAHARAARARHVARSRGRARGPGHDRARVARPHRLVAHARVRPRRGPARDLGRPPRCASRPVRSPSPSAPRSRPSRVGCCCLPASACVPLRRSALGRGPHAFVGIIGCGHTTFRIVLPNRIASSIGSCCDRTAISLMARCARGAPASSRCAKSPRRRHEVVGRNHPTRETDLLRARRRRCVHRSAATPSRTAS